MASQEIKLRFRFDSVPTAEDVSSDECSEMGVYECPVFTYARLFDIHSHTAYLCEFECVDIGRVVQKHRKKKLQKGIIRPIGCEIFVGGIGGEAKSTCDTRRYF